MKLKNKLSLLLTVLSINCFGQIQNDTSSFLVMYKPRAKKNRVIFPLNYEYQFKVDAKKGWITGILLKAKNDTIFLNSDTLSVNEIQKIKTPFYRNGILFFGQLFNKGGIGLMIIGPFNNIINKDKPIIDALGITGAGLYLASYPLKFFQFKSYKTKGRLIKTVYFY